MKKSDSITALAAALAKAQAQMEGAKKDSKNPAFNSKYADFASCVAAIKVPFADNGLSFIQFPCSRSENEIGMETMLMHASGEWVCSEPFYMPVAKASAHGFGSILTYLRRYGLTAATGLPQEDDDANAGVDPKKPQFTAQSATALINQEFHALPDDKRTELELFASVLIASKDDPITLEKTWKSRPYDNDTTAALWSLLPSPVKTSINKLVKKNEVSPAEQA